MLMNRTISLDFEENEQFQPSYARARRWDNLPLEMCQKIPDLKQKS